MSTALEFRLLSDPVPGSGLVSVCLAFPGPDAAEEAGCLGWTGLLFEILRAGGGHFPEAEVTSRFDKWGGGLQATVGHSFATLRYTCLSRYLEESLAYLLSFCAPGTVPEVLFERERAARIALIAEERSDPAADAMRRVRERLWGENPLSTSPLGTEADLGSAAPVRLTSFAGRILRANQAFLAVSGEFGEVPVRKTVTEYFSRPSEAPLAPEPGELGPPFQAAEHHLGEQSVVVQAFPVVGTGSPDWRLLSLYTGCLNGLSGPLFEEIRERHGLAYYCSARIIATSRDGLLAFVSGCSADRATFLAERLGEILWRVAREGFSDSEFAAGLAQARAGLRLNRQRTEWRAFRMATRCILGLPPDLGGSDEKFWNRVSQNDLREWAVRGVNPKKGSTLFFLPGEPG